MNLSKRALLWLLGAATVWAAAGDPLVQQADLKLKSRDFNGALALYRKALARRPDDAPLLLRASIAAQGAGDAKAAATMLAHGHKVAPDDWRLEERLILVYQDTGQGPAAEALATDLVQRWNRKSDPALSATQHFLRDQVADQGEQYDVYQLFSPQLEPGHHLFDFVQVDEKHEPLKIYYVEWSPFNNRYEFALLAPGQGNNAYYGNCQKPPSYTQALGIFSQVWAGRIKATIRPVTPHMPGGIVPGK
ncbi:MAG TPA: tetratricopeptide repeat protein [Candidatus Xenobia bacterium]|jgi:tetratricopeptide (TPR) repeat protein